MTLFFDQYINLFRLEDAVKKCELNEIEKKEIWNLIDLTIQYRFLNLILSHLPKDHHSEFLNLYMDPYNIEITSYLNSLMPIDVEQLIIEESENIEQEILKEIFS